MTTVRPATSAEAASWLLRTDVHWWDVVRYGPPGFDVYVRVAFADESPEEESEVEPDRVGQALATLSEWTVTPASAWAAIWEGWISGTPLPRAPRVDIPHRVMLLFTGPVAALRDAPSLAWFGSVQHGGDPHFVWPDDRAWCLACEVDEDIEFTVGCSVGAADALAAALPGAVRRVAYGEAAPLYRDE